MFGVQTQEAYNATCSPTPATRAFCPSGIDTSQFYYFNPETAKFGPLTLTDFTKHIEEEKQKEQDFKDKTPASEPATFCPKLLVRVSPMVEFVPMSMGYLSVISGFIHDDTQTMFRFRLTPPTFNDDVQESDSDDDEKKPEEEPEPVEQE